MESVMPEIERQLREKGAVHTKKSKEDDDELEEDDMDESALNELFGFGSSVKKPAKALSLDNTDDENADLFIEWCAYFMSEASNNVAKGLAAFFKSFGDILVKSPMIITKGIVKLMSGAIKSSVYEIHSISTFILAAVSALIRLIAMGAEKAKDALSQLYSYITRGITAFYKKFASNTEEVSTKSKDTLKLWLGVIAGCIMLCAYKIQGAVETFGDFFKKVFDDLKEKKDSAVLIVKTWLQCKSDAVKEWISDIAGDIRKSTIDAWNKLDKSVRKAYNNVAEKLEKWMGDIKELVSYTKEKIEDTAKQAKSFAINKKDKALVWGIQKGVKGLSSKYTEDQVVALVRKCYNESIDFESNKGIAINEKYFYAKNTRKRLFENRRNIVIKNGKTYRKRI